LRQRLRQTLAIPGELCSQDVGKIQYVRSKISHHSFGRSLQTTSSQCPQSLKEEKISRVPYTSAVGSLMYAMVCTRPDLAYIVSILNQFIKSRKVTLGSSEVGTTISTRDCETRFGVSEIENRKA